MSNLFLLITALIAFVMGFLIAFVFLTASYRKKQADALLRENNLKAFYVQEQHQSVIRETTLQHDLAQARQHIQDTKEELNRLIM